jgi:hypothetical protein
MIINNNGNLESITSFIALVLDVAEDYRHGFRVDLHFSAELCLC